VTDKFKCHNAHFLIIIRSAAFTLGCKLANFYH